MAFRFQPLCHPKSYKTYYLYLLSCKGKCADMLEELVDHKGDDGTQEQEVSTEKQEKPSLSILVQPRTFKETCCR